MLKKSIAICAASVAALSAAFAFGGCGNNFTRYTKVYNAFGTYATLYLEGEFLSDEQKQVAIDIGDEVGAILEDIEGVFSTAVPTSDVCKFNSADPGATVEISEQMYTVLSLALDLYEETGGCYNAGVYYSVDLYGFTARHSDEDSSESMPYDRENYTQLPDESYIQAFYELSQSFADIRLLSADESYYAVKPQKTVEVDGVTYSLAIDLSGIAKGYTVDIVNEYILSIGYDHSAFLFGSSSVAANQTYGSDSGAWYMEFRDPRTSTTDDDEDDDYFIGMDLKDTAVSISGDYENCYIVDGVRYCHIIDPATGSPIQNGMVMASCIGGTAAEADARTTAIMVMGLDGALEYINSAVVKESGLKIWFIYQSSSGEYYFITNIPEGEYEVLRGNYTLASTFDEEGNVVFTGTK